VSNTELQTPNNSQSSHVYRLSVGRVHPLWETWKASVARHEATYAYTVAGHELTWFLARPCQAEIDAFCDGLLQVEFHVEGPAMSLRFGFGDDSLPNTAEFSNRTVPAGRRALPPLAHTTNGPARLLATLVDRSTGVVLALRMVSLPPAFTNVSHAAIRERADSAAKAHGQTPSPKKDPGSRPNWQAATLALGARATGSPWRPTEVVIPPWGARVESGRVAQKDATRPSERR